MQRADNQRIRVAWSGKDECGSLHAEGLLLNFELQLPIVELLALRLQLLLRHNLILNLQHHISLQWQALIWFMWKQGVSEGTDALKYFPERRTTFFESSAPYERHKGVCVCAMRQ